MTTYDLIRSFGLVAYLAFSLSLALGVASLSGGSDARALDRRVVRQLLHRSAAVVGLLALAAHLTLTVLDTYVATSVTAVLVPFTAGYQVVALGLGSVALYCFVVAAGSGWLRLATARLLSERGWRWLHRAAYVGWGVCLLHGILAGPDAGRVWALATYGLGVAVVGGGLIAHLAARRHLLRRDLDGAIHLREAR